MILSSGVEAGVDEAGRGPLVGPVFAAAVILPADFFHPLLGDSKKVTPSNRQILRQIIEQAALAWCVAQVSARQIDEINILQATFRAMNKAALGLGIKPEKLLIDGNRFRNETDIPFETIVKGDAKHSSIAAASILAKTHRDEYMKNLALQYPEYGWGQNMGYPTAKHLQAIELHGLTPYHRLTFRGCK